MPELPPGDLEEAVERAGSWDSIRGGRLLITGGTGFIGRWLLETFARANSLFGLGASAVVVTRDAERFRRAAPHLASRADIVLHTGDIRSCEFPQGPFSHVIHGAGGSYRRDGGDPLEILDTTMAGTRRMLEFCASADCQDVLLVSSGAVYGPQPEQVRRLPEDWPGAPSTFQAFSAYGEGKRVAELLCEIYRRRGVETRIARCFTFLGPLLPLDEGFAAGNFIADALAGRPILVKGDGRTARSYLYAGDLAAWLWTILFRGVPGQAYNVGSDQEITIRELAERIACASAPPAPVQIAGSAKPGPAGRYVPSIEKARTLLGLQVAVSLDEGIRRTLAFYGRPTTSP